VNCLTPWEGGPTGGSPTASVPHYPGIKEGTVLEWEVTADVQAAVQGGAQEVAWLLKKMNEKKGGEVVYYSKEGSQATVGDLSDALRLVLEYD
jgi:hypothetical protein